MYTYLLNLTFYAGSDAPEDTDRDLFIMKTSEVYSKEQIEKKSIPCLVLMMKIRIFRTVTRKVLTAIH